MTEALPEAIAALASDPARAARVARELIRAEPQNRDAHIVLAEALRREGNLDAALAEVQPLAENDRTWFAAQRLLGLVQASRDEHRAAADALARASELNPGHAYVWCELAAQLRAAGDVEASRAAYLNHVQRAALDPRLLRASAALGEGKPEQARAILGPYLAQHPSDPIALSMMAEANAREDRPLEAEQGLRRIIDLVPGYLPVRHSLGQLLMGLGQYDEAVSVARALAEADPGNVGPQKLLAAALGLVGEYEQAVAIYRRLLADNAAQPTIWLALGHTLKTMGETGEAVEAYRKSIALDPAQGDAYWSLANLKRFKFSDEDVATMTWQLQSGKLAAPDRVSMLYALGAAYEARGEVARAFESYSAGARLHQPVAKRPPLTLFAPAARSVFTREFFEELGETGSPATDPIFIVGLPRAGSTLVEQILASHSQVEGTMELPDINMLAMRIAGSNDPEEHFKRLQALSRAELRGLGESYLQSTRSHRKLGRAHFIDKMPNNFAHTGLIHLILPNAKIIDVRRHPLACGWSCFKQHFALGQLFTYDLAEIGRYYADYVALMAHFDTVLPGRVHRVIYEQLVADPETEIRRLLKYCDLPFEAAVLAPHETQRPVHTASSEQVRQPISASGLDSWKPYEPWLGPLKAALGETLSAYPGVPDYGASSASRSN
ncbi:MAG: sulfotransferase [Proteobacteria bacterium]|nr:sulfotransferase [Pseudomonadota bacterium]